MAVFTIHTVPDGIKREFKKACKTNRISMAAATIDFMVDYIGETTSKTLEGGSLNTPENESLLEGFNVGDDNGLME